MTEDQGRCDVYAATMIGHAVGHRCPRCDEQRAAAREIDDARQEFDKSRAEGRDTVESLVRALIPGARL